MPTPSISLCKERIEKFRASRVVPETLADADFWVKIDESLNNGPKS